MNIIWIWHVRVVTESTQFIHNSSVQYIEIFGSKLSEIISYQNIPTYLKFINTQNYVKSLPKTYEMAFQRL
jgi:hypothetical protein